MTSYLFWAAVAWAVLLFARHGMLTRLLFTHVKDEIRAEQYAADKLRRRRSRRLGRDRLQSPITVAHASPYRHVTLLCRPLFWVWPIRRHVAGAVIHWTPLVKSPTADWLGKLTAEVAHFLGVDPDQVTRTRTWPLRRMVWVKRDSGRHAYLPPLPLDFTTREISR